ncbi:MAG: efflux RND transporter permease subunit [Luminiphilus sp.]|nr:efflux RND transporter permease subunit [Luminiphilus sp.]
MSIHPEDRPRWTDIFVRRPIVSVVLSLALLLVGVRAAINLPVIQFPVIQSSSLEIVTVYPGASAETVRGFIAEPIERVAASVPGVNYVESSTTAGRSLVKVWLKLNEDSTDALAELNTRLSQIRYELPDGAEDPSIEVLRADSPYASFYLALSVPKGESFAEMADLVQRDILPRLSSVPDVQNAISWGSRPAMRIWLDTARMAALGISASDIQSALRDNNVISTLGQSQNSLQRIDLVSNTEARTPETFANIVLRSDPINDIRLSDVAMIEEGSEEVLELSRFSLQDVVFTGIYPTPGANEINVADALYDEVANINDSLPEGLEFFIAYDVTSYMREALKEIFITLGETIILVGFVVIALMGSARTALVPLLTIPISILGAMTAMSLMGFSLNLLTILAIVLSVGLVVDDAIVVVENVAKNLRQGMSRREAALRSSRRLLAPIIAMTLTLAVVYAPIGLLGGLTGFLFREFAFTLAVAVLISGLVAMTLSPIMSAWVCPSSGHETGATRWVNERFDRTAQRYGSIVDRAIRYRWQLIFAGIFFSLLTAPLYLFSLKELAPIEDQSGINVISDAAPESAIEDTYRSMDAVVNRMAEFEGATDFWHVVQPSGSYGGQDFTPPGTRSRTLQDMLFEMYSSLQNIPSLNAFPVSSSDLPAAGQFDVEVAIASSDDARTMLPHAQALLQAAKESGLFLFADTDLRVDLVQARINFDRQRLADLNMTIDDIASQVGVLNSEGYITRYDNGGRAYRVIPKVARAERDSPDAVLDLPIRTASGDLIPLGAVASLERITAPRALTRFQQKNAFKIFGGVIPGTTKEQGLAFIEQAAAELLPEGYILDYTGESREIRSEGNTLLGVLGIAMALVFFVLAVQFNSFRDPLIILLGSIPLALFAALVITFVNLTTVNIYSQVGLITLAGLVSKNAILIVEFANQAQREGLDKLAAIRAASISRLRPVLMTTGATVLGHLPLVLVTGAGSEARNSIGFILVVGMLIGTFFTLVLLPAIYAVLASDHRYEDAESTPAATPIATSH